jgi:hypothetical protein
VFFETYHKFNWIFILISFVYNYDVQNLWLGGVVNIGTTYCSDHSMISMFFNEIAQWVKNRLEDKLVNCNFVFLSKWHSVFTVVAFLGLRSKSGRYLASHLPTNCIFHCGSVGYCTANLNIYTIFTSTLINN